MTEVIVTPNQSGLMAYNGDTLLPGASVSKHYQMLIGWYQQRLSLGLTHEFIQDYHRLQMEYWIWKHWEDGHLDGTVLDIGAQTPRRWIGFGKNYQTFGNTDDAECDIQGDLLGLQLIERRDYYDAVICTEVLEHCADPFTAVRNMLYVLRPGGLLLATSPFFWPWHGTVDYPDYWRFTFQGWQHLLKDFTDVHIVTCEWTEEGEQGYNLMRRFETMGFSELVRASTGYLCEGRKP